MKNWQLHIVVSVVLFGGVAIHAYYDAISKHTGIEFPAGRGFAVCAPLAFSALFAFIVFKDLKSGRVTLGRGSIAFFRSENPAGFYLALVGIAGASLFVFHEGVRCMFAK
jgi:hypothetical protein